MFTFKKKCGILQLKMALDSAILAKIDLDR